MNGLKMSYKSRRADYAAAAADLGKVASQDESSQCTLASMASGSCSPNKNEFCQVLQLSKQNALHKHWRASLWLSLSPPFALLTGFLAESGIPK